MEHRWELVCCTLPTTRFPEFTKKWAVWPSLFCPEASVIQPIPVKNIIVPKTFPFKIIPSLCLLQDSMRGEGAAGVVAVATLAKE